MSSEKSVFRSGIHLSIKKIGKYISKILSLERYFGVELESSPIETKSFQQELLSSEALWLM